MNRILKILPFLLLCAFALQVMPVGAQQQMFLQRTQQSAPPPSAGLLDPDYKGSAFAAAIDVLLYGSYTATDDIPGSQTFGQQGQWSVAVLRDFDDAIKSFTPSQVADGTANTWVQALGPSDGFVRRWYDQSVTALDVSNLNHAEQSDPTKMPKLFDSSTGLILENGKAAMDFDGVNDYLTATFAEITQPTTHVIVAKFNILDENKIIIDGNNDNATRQISLFNRNTGNTDIFAGNLVPFATNDTNQNSYFIKFNGALSEASKNGNNTTGLSAGTNSLQNLTIGSNLAKDAFATTTLQGIIIYPSDQSANRAAIESAINTEYNIY